MLYEDVGGSRPSPGPRSSGYLGQPLSSHIRAQYLVDPSLVARARRSEKASTSASIRSVICCLFASGINRPTRFQATPCVAGMSVRSISLSASRARRAFACFVSAGGRVGSKVNLTVPVVFALMSLCLSCGDEPDRFTAQRISHHDLKASTRPMVIHRASPDDPRVSAHSMRFGSRKTRGAKRNGARPCSRPTRNPSRRP